MRALFAIVLSLLVAGAAGAAPAAREILLFDFEQAGGGINLGGEFPGARGEFKVVPEAAHAGKSGGRLSFDLTKGAYVAWGYGLPLPIPEGAQTLSVWVRSDAAGRKIHCKTRDTTGQEHIRYAGSAPAGTWTRLTYDLAKMHGHWNGANDGKIHWPITYVQIGIEPGSGPKVGALDLDDLTLHTTASRAAMPGVVLDFSAPTFGNLFGPREKPSFRVSLRSLEQREKQSFHGAYRVTDWQEREVARGDVSLDAGAEESSRTLAFPKLPAGAFRVSLDLRNAADAEETLAASAWFGVLPGPNPKPCAWVGSGLHAGHGWGHGDLRFLDILSAAGIGVVREEFGWSGIEKEKGKYAVSPRVEAFVDALVKRGIRLNLLLTYGNPVYENPLDPDAYARWAAWMAKHFEGRVSHFEIWNEPANFWFQKQYGGARWGNAPWIGKFVELTRKASAAIRAARKDATVIVSAEDCWPTLKQMIEEGIGPAGDVYSIHPYCHGQPRPEREWFLKDGGRELRETSRKHGGPDRVVITEAGWTTYEGEMEYLAIAGGYPRSSYVHQAQYLVRMFLAARASGVEYSIQYDFKNDGPRRSYTEHNFGLVHEDYSPKPSLMAVAALTRLLGQGRFVRDAAPDSAVARAYVFDVAGKPVVAAYAVEGEATLKLPVGRARIQVADLMGNRKPLPTPDGIATLALTETPVYLLGADARALSRFARLEVGDVPSPVAAGDTTVARIRVENYTGGRLRPALACEAPAGVTAVIEWPGGKTPDLPDGRAAEGSVTVRVGTAVRDPFEVVLRGSPGATPVERRIRITPRPPLQARFGTLLRTAAGWQGSATLVNESRRVLAVKAEVQSQPGMSAQPLSARVEPGQSVQVPYTVTRWPEGTLPIRVTARTEDGWESTHAGIAQPGSILRLGAAPAVDGDLADWQGGSAGSVLHLADAAQFAKAHDAWGGPADLSAVVRPGWCPEGFCVGVQVSDDRFHQPHAGSEVWQADSIQMAMTPERPDGGRGPAYLEIGLARTPEGDRVLFYSSMVDPTVQQSNPVRFASRPNGSGGLTYEALIPWALLPGVRPEAGSTLAFDLLVNDSDGQGRRGWLELFGGIGWSKDVIRYGRMVLARQ